MDYGTIFQDTHKQVRLQDLVPMTEELFYKFHGENQTFEDWSERVESYGYDLSRFYIHPEGSIMNTFFYVGEYGTVKFPTIKDSWLGIDLNVDLQKHDEYAREMFEQGNYEMYFFPEMNSMPVDYFIRHYKKIPKEQRFEVFSDLYMFLEDGFTVFPKELIKEVVALAPENSAMERILENHKVKNGMITVYRGMTSESTPLEESMSWTLNLKVAKFFAKRFKAKGSVYRATIPVEKILHYIEDRNEEEVWLEYKDLEKVRKIRF